MKPKKAKWKDINCERSLGHVSWSNSKNSSMPTENNSFKYLRSRRSMPAFYSVFHVESGTALRSTARFYYGDRRTPSTLSDTRLNLSGGDYNQVKSEFTRETRLAEAETRQTSCKRTKAVGAHTLRPIRTVEGLTALKQGGANRIGRNWFPTRNICGVCVTGRYGIYYQS